MPRKRRPSEPSGPKPVPRPPEQLVKAQLPKVGPWRLGKSAPSRSIHGRATGKR